MQRHTHRSHFALARNGFSLLEVLIALVVLSVGLLGIAGLQVSGMRFTYSANVQGTAAILAQNMIDKMRANSGGGTGGGAATGATSSVTSAGATSVAAPGGVISGYYDNLLSAPSSPPDCVSAACTPQQIAQSDAADWYTNLSGNLPSGTGSVQCVTSGVCDSSVTAGQSAYLITVCWDDGVTTSNGTTTPDAGCGTKPGSTAYTSDSGGTYQVTFLPVIP